MSMTPVKTVSRLCSFFFFVNINLSRGNDTRTNLINRRDRNVSKAQRRRYTRVKPITTSKSSTSSPQKQYEIICIRDETWRAMAVKNDILVFDWLPPLLLSPRLLSVSRGNNDITHDETHSHARIRTKTKQPSAVLCTYYAPFACVYNMSLCINEILSWLFPPLFIREFCFPTTPDVPIAFANNYSRSPTRFEISYTHVYKPSQMPKTYVKQLQLKSMKSCENSVQNESNWITRDIL